jgi:hypothetical protein
MGCESYDVGQLILVAGFDTITVVVKQVVDVVAV